jgi:hypothetical protein
MAGASQENEQSYAVEQTTRRAARQMIAAATEFGPLRPEHWGIQL